MTNGEKRKVAIFGGNGFVGSRLVAALNVLQYEISVFDTSPVNIENEIEGVTYVQGDICQKMRVCDFLAVHRPHFVIHLSSWGMSGGAMLEEKCYDINVLGTQNIIDACLEYGVKYLIYTSTYNVVFGGNEIVNGDENMPVYDYKKHSDRYAPSKTLAEQLVMSINGTLTTSKHPLLTCSLRPAAIYGEGEARHFPRIVKHIDRCLSLLFDHILIFYSGLLTCRIGNAIVDWVHVDNLVLNTVLSCRVITYSGPCLHLHNKQIRFRQKKH